MAEDKLVLTLTWENNKTMKLRSKKNQDNVITILETDENGNFKNMWPYLKDAMETYIEHELDTIGTAMKG